MVTGIVALTALFLEGGLGGCCLLFTVYFEAVLPFTDTVKSCFTFYCSFLGLVITFTVKFAPFTFTAAIL